MPFTVCTLIPLEISRSLDTIASTPLPLELWTSLGLKTSRRSTYHQKVKKGKKEKRTGEKEEEPKEATEKKADAPKTKKKEKNVDEDEKAEGSGAEMKDDTKKV